MYYVCSPELGGNKEYICFKNLDLDYNRDVCLNQAFNLLGPDWKYSYRFGPCLDMK